MRKFEMLISFLLSPWGHLNCKIPKKPAKLIVIMMHQLEMVRCQSCMISDDILRILAELRCITAHPRLTRQAHIGHIEYKTSGKAQVHYPCLPGLLSWRVLGYPTNLNIAWYTSDLSPTSSFKYEHCMCNVDTFRVRLNRHFSIEKHIIE